jgi:hypothetical protein
MSIKYFLITAVLAIAIFGFGGAVKAETTDISAMIAQLQAEITRLTAQMQTLQAGQQSANSSFNANANAVANANDNSAVSASTSWCYTFTKPLSEDDRGEEVAALQIALTNEGLYAGAINGFYNASVTVSVKAFQKKYKINQAGYVGRLTRAKLNERYGCKTTPTPVQPSITITSPNGGEIWKIGETHNILWQSSGLTGHLNIHLVNQVTLAESSISSVDIPLSGTYSWTIPSTLATGSYKVLIFYAAGDVTVNGYSNIFSITNSVAPTPTTCTYFSYTGWTACSLSGTQTRTIVSSYPTGCVGGSPVLSQTCVPAVVTVYRAANYEWASQEYSVGSYTFAQMKAKDTLDNDISSVKVAPGYKVTFYDADNFLGFRLVKIEDDPSFVNDGFNDMASSMKVELASTTTYTLTTSATNGTITKNPDQSTYTPWTAVNLTATPNIGYQFVNWTGDVSTTANPTTVVMTSNKSVTANFIAVPADNCRLDSASGAMIGNVYKETAELCKATWDNYASSWPGSKVYFNGILIHTYPMLTCTAFSYSEWSSCSASGTKTRTITLSYPTGCTGGSPELTQTCTPATPQPSSGSITITSPTSGANWVQGSTQTISWTSTGVNFVKIQMVQYGVGYDQVVGLPASQGQYTWTVHAGVPTGSGYAIKIIDQSNSSVSAISNFNIVASPLTVYRAINYVGTSQMYGVGSYTLAQMRAKGTLNDDISSVKVAPGYRAILFTADNFGGSTIVETADDPTLVNDGLNDTISSMKVEAIQSPSMSIIDSMAASLASIAEKLKLLLAQ